MKLNKMKTIDKKLTTTLLIAVLLISTLAIVNANPDLTITSIYELADATWDDTDKQVGTYSAKLEYVDHAYLEFVPHPGIKISDLANIVEDWSFWYMWISGGTYGPLLELRFTGPNFDADTGAEHVDITVNTAESDPVADTWTEEAVTSDSTATGYGNDGEGDGFYDGSWSPGTSTGNEKLSELVALVTTLAEDPAWDGSDPADWELTRVRVELWTIDTCYIDDITLNGVLYSVEPVGELGGGYVGDTLTVSGTSTSPGGLIKVYWDSVKAWDGTAGLLEEDYAVGTTYGIDVTIPEAVAGTHYVIVKDIEAAGIVSATLDVVPEIVLDPTAGVDGDTITVTGTGYGEEEVIKLSYSPTDTTLTTTPTEVTTSTLGSFEASFDIPEEMTDDPTTITAEGLTSGESAEADLSYGTVITLTPKTGLTGTMVTIEGRGFTADDIIDVRWFFTDVVFLTLINDYTIAATGEFTETFTVPMVDPNEYTVKAVDSDTENPIATTSFKVTGVTDITLTPDTGLVGGTFDVTGDWFTPSSTVDIVFDGTVLATDVSTGTETGDFTESGLIVPDVALGSYTVTVTDEEGIYATATFTVIEEVITIETRSDSYDPGDTISFTIESTVAFVDDAYGDKEIAIMISDPDGGAFWDLAWDMVSKPAPSNDYYVPYSGQLDAASQHLTLPSDAEQGIWEWTATYQLVSGTDIEETGIFTVGEAVGPQPDLPAETINQEPLDSTGAPKSSFTLGETVLASAEVTNAGTQSQPMLIAVQWTDPDLRALAPVFMIVTLAPGQSFTYAPGLTIPLAGYATGTWTANVLVLDTWPAQGGVTIGAPVTITITVTG